MVVDEQLRAQVHPTRVYIYANTALIRSMHRGTTEEPRQRKVQIGSPIEVSGTKAQTKSIGATEGH